MMNRFAALALVCVSSVAFAGDLNPAPGPVAPTMKALDEVEPRVALSQSNTPGTGQYQFRITQPGSYYLAGDVTTDAVKGGIQVTTDDVTIDLNGFTMRYGGGVITQSDGVSAAGRTNITVRNGTLSGFNASGVVVGDRGVVENMRVIGCAGAGVNAGEFSRITGCVSSENSQSGYTIGDHSMITDCFADSNTAGGLLCGSVSVLRGCVASGNSGAGIFAGFSVRLVDCVSVSNTTVGIFAGDNASVSGCLASDNLNTGISCGQESVVTNCTSLTNNQQGFVLGNGSTVTACSSRVNSQAGFLLGTGTLIADCVSVGNGLEGISCTNNATIRGCVVSQNSRDGILATSDCTIEGNTCDSNGFGTSADGAGIHVLGADNRIDSNNVTDSDRGLDVDSPGNFVVRNTLSGNTENADVVAGNDMGTLQTSPVGAGPWDNFSY